MSCFYWLRRLSAVSSYFILTVSGIIGTLIIFAWLRHGDNTQYSILPLMNSYDKIDLSKDFNTNVTIRALSAREILDYFLWTNHTSCRLSHDFGGLMMKNPPGLDGQKSVCLDPTVAPRTPGCIVYSFGINNEWSFDEAMEKYGCQVFAFDPSMQQEDHDHTSNIHFFNLALDSQDSAKKNRSLSTIYNKDLSGRHGRRLIDYLKIDVEFAEWHILPQVLQSGMLNKVRQLAVEFHFSPKDTIDVLRDKVAVLRSLENYGLVRFNSRYNPWFYGPCFCQEDEFVSCGFEITWYNNKLRRRFKHFDIQNDWTLRKPNQT